VRKVIRARRGVPVDVLAPDAPTEPNEPNKPNEPAPAQIPDRETTEAK